MGQFAPSEPKTRSVIVVYTTVETKTIIITNIKAATIFAMIALFLPFLEEKKIESVLS